MSSSPDSRSSLARSQGRAIAVVLVGWGSLYTCWPAEALPVNSLLIDSYSARGVESSVAHLIRCINNMERRILYEHAA